VLWALGAYWWAVTPLVVFGALELLVSNWLGPSWAPVERLWTDASLAMLPSALYGLAEALADVRAAQTHPRREAVRIAAWWWLSAALLFVAIFGGFALIGVVAGNAPPRPVEVGVVETQASVISAAVFFLIGGLASACLLYGLWSRVRIRAALRLGAPRW
jgi:hypothetical protein